MHQMCMVLSKNTLVDVYGSEQEHSRSLRNLARNTGLLKTGLLQTTSGKNLLPFNTRAPMDCQVYMHQNIIVLFFTSESFSLSYLNSRAITYT